MSRVESCARAEVLRREGLKYREIAERMGVATSTVGEYFRDPDGSKLKARQRSYGGECMEVRHSRIMRVFLECVPGCPGSGPV